MVRKVGHKARGGTYFRDFWGANKRTQLIDSLEAPNFYETYKVTNPTGSNRYSFKPSTVSAEYTQWPKIADLSAIPGSNGLMEKRGGVLIDIDRERLEERMRAYFNADLGWSEYQTLGYGLTKNQAGFDPQATRQKALHEEVFDLARIVRYTIRPFDTQWCYYTAVGGVWNRSRPQLWRQHGNQNSFVVTRFSSSKNPEGVPFFFTYNLCDDHLLSPDATAFSD